jgi:type IV pilus assembly protein PilV
MRDQLALTFKQCRAEVQAGSSLIEVMVSILLLSFGILAIALTMAYAVQMPKLAGYRATAVDLANNYVERMRANPGALASYAAVATSYTGAQTPIAAGTPCAYPSCTSASLVTMDSQQIQSATRAQLPAGGVFVSCDDSAGSDSACSNGFANVWIIWQQPDTFAAIVPATSDNCPSAVTSAAPQPRCLYGRFKL